MKKWIVGAMALALVAGSVMSTATFADVTVNDVSERPARTQQKGGGRLEELIQEYYPEAQDRFDALETEMEGLRDQLKEQFGDRTSGLGDKVKGMMGQRGGRGGRGQKVGMDSVIELTDDQKVILEDHHAAKKAEMEALKESGEKPERPTEEERQADRDALFAKLNLTDEQTAQLDAHKAEMEAKRAEMEAARENGEKPEGLEGKGGRGLKSMGSRGEKPRIDLTDADAVKAHIDEALTKMEEHISQLKEKLAE